MTEVSSSLNIWDEDRDEGFLQLLLVATRKRGIASRDVELLLQRLACMPHLDANRWRLKQAALKPWKVLYLQRTGLWPWLSPCAVRFGGESAGQLPPMFAIHW